MDGTETERGAMSAQAGPLDRVRQMLSDATAQTGPDAGVTCLKASSKLVEHAAFELANTCSATQVARLIVMAADLERLAQDMRNAHSRQPCD